MNDLSVDSISAKNFLSMKFIFIYYYLMFIIYFRKLSHNHTMN